MEHYEITGPIGPVKLEVVKTLIYKLKRAGKSVFCRLPVDWWHLNLGVDSVQACDVIVEAACGLLEPLAIWHAPDIMHPEHRKIPLHTIMPRHLLRELYEAHGTDSGLPKMRASNGRKEYVKPVGWRPRTEEIKDEYKRLGGGTWLNAVLQKNIEDQPHAAVNLLGCKTY